MTSYYSDANRVVSNPSDDLMKAYNNGYRSMSNAYQQDDMMDAQATSMQKQYMQSSEKPMLRQTVDMPYQQGMRTNTNYNFNPMTNDYKSLLKRAVKYLVEGIVVAFVAYYFTKGKLNAKEIVLLGITAAFVFAILDTVSPTVSLGARLGAGFGIGQTMFGLSPALAAGATLV